MVLIVLYNAHALWAQQKMKGMSIQY
jgi:hypothetical protein